jgi:proteic killer suppression protein
MLYHDEPLKGDRLGQRSIRLSRSYRLIYIESQELGVVKVVEVNKHEY